MPMVPLTDLWLPIALAAVIVFVASSILHMALPWHRGDYRRLPAEDETMPRCASSLFRPATTSFRARAAEGDDRAGLHGEDEEGPVMFATVMPSVPSGRPTMGAQLAWWFVYCLVVGVFAAYIAGARSARARTISPCSASPAQPRSSATASRSGRTRSGTSGTG